MGKYDVCIIGGGPSGYAAAMRAIDLGKKICLIEKTKLGGAGLYNGALSSKALWELSKDVATTRKKSLSFSGNTFTFDFKEVVNELNAAVAERKFQLEKHVELLSSASYGNQFDHLKGTGKLISKNEIELTDDKGNKSVIEAENIIIATGSRPRHLPNIPIDGEIIVTSDTIHDFEKLPKSMVVLGAGVIGCEYATIYSNFGKTDVNIIDKADRILPFEDADVVNVIENNLEKNGVHIHRNSRLERMEVVDGVVEYELSYKEGSNKLFRVEKALVSVGRVPNTENLGLEDVGVKLNERGMIEDHDTQTSVPNIYAVGDVTADIALVNVGELEGRHAIEKIYGLVNKEISYDNISTIMFLNPLVAAVGMNEQQCQQKGIQYKVASIDFSCIPRAIAMRSKQGFFKLLVTNDDDMKILGMRALGVQASSAIQAVALMINLGIGIEELAELIHPHPSLIEGIQECARMLTGKPLFKPSIFSDIIKCQYYDGEKYNEMYDLTVIKN